MKIPYDWCCLAKKGVIVRSFEADAERMKSYHFLENVVIDNVFVCAFYIVPVFICVSKKRPKNEWPHI